MLNDNFLTGQVKKVCETLIFMRKIRKQKEFYSPIEVSEPQASAMYSAKNHRNFPETKINNLIQHWGVSKEYLLSGKEPMFTNFEDGNKSVTENNNNLSEYSSGILRENETVYQRKPNPRLEAETLHLAADPADYDNDGTPFEELPDGTIRMRVPVIPQKAFAGYLRGFQDPDYYEDLTYISVEVFKKHRGHYLAFEVRGDSMTTLEPVNFRKSIFDGIKVVGRELPRHQWAYKLHTHNWDAWVIVHKTEGILIKTIAKHDVDNGIITIHSLNPDKELYPDQDLHLDDIEQIFNVVKKIDE